MDTGDAAKAFDTIRPLASSALGTPQDLVLYEEAARASGQVGRIDTALAAAPPERRIAALLARGDAAIARKEWGSAIDAYEQLRGWAGDSNAIVLNNLAYAHSQTGNTAKALETAEKAARIAPDNASVLDTLGWILVQSGEDRARGTQMLERAARMAPSNAAIKRHLAAARKG
jgi:tetratricopeptide (TPR) repeat protein